MEKYTFENLNMVNESKNATINEASVLPRIDEDGKMKVVGEQFCEITGKKSRYLFAITNSKDETKLVSANIAMSAGFTQKQLDKVYSLAWNKENPSAGGSGKSKEEVENELAGFLGGEAEEL